MITAFGNIPSIKTESSLVGACRINKLIHLGIGTGVTSLANAFNSQSLLTAVPEGFFDNCSEVTDFTCTFSGCTSLTAIPEELFDKCIKVTSIQELFRDAAI